MRLYLQNPVGLAALAALAAVVALHLLARRRVRVTVPTLLIWRRVAARAADGSVRRRRLDLSLILRLAAAALMAACIAGPVVFSPGAQTRRVVVVLDNSLTMQSAGPGGASRLEEARRSAEGLLAELGETDSAALVVAAPHARAVAEMGSPSEARAALARVRPVDRPAELVEAVSVAAARASRQRARVYVFTDRDRPQALEEQELEWLTFGSPSRNAALVAMDADARGRRHLLFLAARNYSDRALSGDLVVGALPAGGAAKRMPFEIPAGGRSSIVTEFAPGDAQAVSVQLQPPDDLAADNQAFAVMSRSRPFRVALVGRPSGAIARAVRASREGAELVEVEDAKAAVELGADLLVLSRVVTAAAPPPGMPVLYVLPPSSVGPLTVEGVRVRGPGALAAAAGSELASGLDLSGVAPPSVASVKVTGPCRAHVTAGGRLVLGEWADGAATRYYLGLVPEDTSWPSDPTWPIIFARLAERHAAPARGELVWRSTSDDSPLRGVPAGKTVSGPRGEYDPRLGLPDAGLYRSGGAAWGAAVLDETASDSRPPAAPASAPPGAPVPAEAPAEHDVGWWLALAALFVLAVEWVLGVREEA